MSVLKHFLIFIIVVSIFCVLFGCNKDDKGVNSDEPGPPYLVKISGDNQTGVINSTLPELMVIRLEQKQGSEIIPVKDEWIFFHLTKGNGNVVAKVSAVEGPENVRIKTNWDGKAAASLRFFSANDSLTVTAETEDIEGLSVDFHLFTLP